MKTRIISGVVAAIILIAVLLFTDILVVRIALAAILTGCIYEALKCFSLEKNIPFVCLGAFLSVVMPFIDMIGFSYMMPILFLSVAVICFSLIFGYKTTTVSRASSMAFLVLLIPFCLSHLIYLRALSLGKFYIWLPILGAFGADIGAYFIGCGIGGRKLCEALSPKKTVAGSVGAFIGSVVAFLIYSFIIKAISDVQINYPVYFLIAVLCGGLSQIGDLTASSLKRANNIKDFGKIMPGHGGIFDRVDSLILIAPVIYYIVTLVPESLAVLWGL